MTVTLTYSEVLRGIMATRTFLLDRNGRVRVPFGNGDLSDKWLPGPGGILGHLLSKVTEGGGTAPAEVVALYDRLSAEPSKPGSDQFAQDIVDVGEATVSLETQLGDAAFTETALETLQLLEEMREIDWGVEADSADNLPVEELADDDCGCDDDFSAEELAFLTAAAAEVEDEAECIPCRERALAVAREANVADPRWEGTLAFEGLPTGDGRLIKPGALRWDVPMGLGWIEKDTGEHNGAEVVGLIDHVERRDTDDPGIKRIWGSGTFDMGCKSGREARRRVRKHLQRGVSVDLDEVAFEVRPATDAMVAGEDLFDGQIRAVTVVRIPAFKDAQIELVAEDPESLVAAGYHPNQLRWPAGAPNGLGGQWRDAPWKLGTDMLGWWDALDVDDINGGDMTDEQVAKAHELFDGEGGMREIIEALEKDGLNQTGQTLFERMNDWSKLMNELNDLLPAGSPARKTFDEFLAKFAGWDGLTAEDYQMLLEGQDQVTDDDLPEDANLDDLPETDEQGEDLRPKGTPMPNPTPTPKPNPTPDPQAGEQVRLDELPKLPDGEEWPDFQGQPEDEDPERKPSYGVVVHRQNGEITSVSISVGEPIGGRVTAFLDSSGKVESQWQNAQGSEISAGEKEAFLKHFPGEGAQDAINQYVRAAFDAIRDGSLDMEELKKRLNKRRESSDTGGFSSPDEFREISSERRKEAADDGEAMPGGSYPIITRSDWDNAVQAIGRAKDRKKVEDHIRKRARALDIPESDWPDWLKKADAQVSTFDGPEPDDFDEDVCIVAVPAENGLPGDIPGGQHVTLAYLGDGLLDEAELGAVRSALSTLAGGQEPFGAKVTGTEIFGDDDDPAQVVTLDPEAFSGLRDQVLAGLSPELSARWEAENRWPEFRPHMTVGYTNQPYEGELPESLDIERLELWNGNDHQSFPLGAEEGASEEFLDAFRAPDLIKAMNKPGTNWVEEVGGLPGYISRIANHLIVNGFTESHAIATAVNTVKRWARGGTVLKHGHGSQHVTPVTIAKAALSLAEWEMKKAMARAMASEVGRFVVAADAEGAEADLEAPVPAPDGDTLDAVEQALQWMRDWLDTDDAKTDPSYTEVANAADEVASIIEEIGTKMDEPEDQAAVVASAAPVRPPAAWFEDPRLDRKTPLTVTEDGRVFGHAASWDECHLAQPMGRNQCVLAPHSRTGYAYFLTGALLTAEGTQVPVGRITLGTGHAHQKANAASAIAHYDNTGTAVADVAAGEDQFGIWVAGAVRPNISEEKVRELRAAPLSGDWRELRGGLEMVAALAVNVPGFPIPRVAGLIASGEIKSLVAAGIVEQEPETQEPIFTADEIRLLKALAQREQDSELMALAEQAEADAEDCGCGLTVEELAEEPVIAVPDNVVALAARRKAAGLALRVQKLRKAD